MNKSDTVVNEKLEHLDKLEHKVMKKRILLLLMISMPMLSGCGYFRQNLVDSTGKISGLDGSPKNKPSVYIENHSYYAWKNGNDLQIPLSQSDETLIRKVIQESALFSTVFSNEQDKHSADILLEFNFFHNNRGNPALMVLKSAITGLSLGLIPTSFDIKFSGILLVSDTNGLYIDEYFNEEIYAYWVGIPIAPFGENHIDHAHTKSLLLRDSLNKLSNSKKYMKYLEGKNN